MKTWKCLCDRRLFFDNDCCTQCGITVGLCPTCWSVAAVEPADDGILRCRNPECGAALRHCDNACRGVCNCLVSMDDIDNELCAFCRLNDVIPDCSIAGNVDKWQKLEVAKRRVLFVVREVGFPVSSLVDGVGPSLRFAFKSDEVETVATGHLNGLITINLREADDVERERTRVEFDEPQRTLAGHFRHELGHYYWDIIVKPNRLAGFREMFGDEASPSYGEARKRYYSEGPPKNWPANFVSAYASMHPWEDFAESFGAYMDMRSLLATANHFTLTTEDSGNFASMLEHYQRLGIIVNELNRDMGLTDIVPEVFTGSIANKLKFIHSLV